MSNIIKISYMDSPNLGYSEYLVKSKNDLSALSPKQGDRAIVLDEGKIYLCVTQGSWEKFGNTAPSGDVTIATTINSESTNDDVAGAAAVWELVQNTKEFLTPTSEELDELAQGLYKVSTDESGPVRFKDTNNNTQSFNNGILSVSFNTVIFFGESTVGYVDAVGANVVGLFKQGNAWAVASLTQMYSDKVNDISTAPAPTSNYPTVQAVIDYVATTISSVMTVDENDVIPGGEG